MAAGFSNIFKMKLGIQAKLTLIFILISSLPLTLVSIFTVNQQIEFQRDQNIRNMHSDIKGLGERTTLFLTRIESEISLVMKSTEMRKLLNNLKSGIAINDELRKNVEKEFINVVADNTFYRRIDLLSPRGKELISIMNNETPFAVPEENLSRISKNFYVQKVKEMKPGEIDLSPSEIKINNSGKFASVIDFILPVYDDQNKLTSIVSVKLRAENLFEILVPSYGDSPRKIFIVNGEGFYIFHSEKKNNWNSLFTDRFDENIFSDYSTELAQKILNGKENSTVYYKDRIIQYSPIFSGSKAESARYFIAEDVNADVILSSTRELKTLLIFLITIVGIISLLVGYLTAKRFLKPVKKLITGTQIIRSGNLDHKIEATTNDEIKDLIDNFNQLVTEWKLKQLLEKEVQRTERLFSSITQAATDAILEVDADGRVIVWNDAASSIFGFNRDEIKGKKIFSYIIPERHRAVAEVKLKDFLRSDKAETQKNIAENTIEIDALRKDGTEFPAELSISRVILDDKIYATGIIRDVTKRKEMLKELIEAKNKAEVADKLKTEFLHQISHEIRTPLNVLLNYTDYTYEDLLERNHLSEPIEQNLKAMKESGLRIIRTVELILNMSSIQTGTYENKPVPTDLFDEIIQKVYNKYYQYAAEKNLKLNLVKKYNGCKLIVDPYSIEQVLSQLVDNAVKFTERGTIHVHYCVDTEGNIEVSVEDTGIGISDEYMKQLFTPFSQEQHGLSRNYDGNGLGLSLAKKLCEMNNVEILVSSQKGKGTVIKLIFPKSITVN